MIWCCLCNTVLICFVAEDEDFDLVVPVVKSDRWEGEDEEEPVKVKLFCVKVIVYLFELLDCGN